MSNIKCEHISLAVYVSALQRKIDEVCRKIGFNDSKVEWHIYEPKIDGISKNNRVFQEVLIGRNGEDFAYTDVNKNEIWISTLSLKKGDNINSLIKQPFKSCNNERDFLAEVIIDEITHIQTGLNHGETQYDNQFLQNIKKYYSSLI